MKYIVALISFTTLCSFSGDPAKVGSGYYNYTPVLYFDMRPYQPAKTVSITFTLDEANMVLKGLGKLPAEESMQLIIKISNEANKQLKDSINNR